MRVSGNGAHPFPLCSPAWHGLPPWSPQSRAGVGRRQNQAAGVSHSPALYCSSTEAGGQNIWDSLSHVTSHSWIECSFRYRRPRKLGIFVHRTEFSYWAGQAKMTTHLNTYYRAGVSLWEQLATVLTPESCVKCHESSFL